MRHRQPLRKLAFSPLVRLSMVLALASGCGPAAHAGPRSPGSAGIGPVRAVPVSDQTFAASAYKVLVEEQPSQERANLLAGVVRHQLLRASQRFQAGERDAGLAALRGAFFLMRKGEFSQEMLVGGADALREGAAEVARVGQEGSALALYLMLKGVLPPSAPERRDVDAHLEALKSFATSTRSSGALLSTASDARRAVQRSLLETTPAAFDDAHVRLIEWLKRALASNAAEMPIQSNVDRDEVLEAYRALRGGGFALVALYLRHGDARGAVVALDEAGMERSIPPDMRESLERCAEDSAPEAWSQFHQFFDSLAHDPQPVLAFDVELVNGATWGSALALFRSEPGSLQGVMPMASLLVDYGMAEVAPLALAPAVVKAPEPDQLGAALGLVLNAMLHESDLGQIDAARRTFLNAAPLFDLADARPNRGKVNPSPARLRYVMAALETSRGELGRAKPLLEAAASAQPTPEVLTTLAALERQRRNYRPALDLLNRVGELGQRSGDDALQGEAAYARFEIHREAGDSAQAAQALEAALRHALSAQRQSQPGGEQARAERLLARVLGDYGERPAAERATARAYQSSGADGRQLSVTIMDTSRRALTDDNLQAAREATQRALDATLPAEDMIYVALWLTLLEKKVGVTSDGLVEEVLASFDEASAWTVKLRQWARGKIDDATLISAARTKPEQTEATFYTAMSRFVRGDTSAYADLEKVAQSEVIDLYEVGIARDLLAARQATAFKLPGSVTLP